jgi:DNA invertase Pin-like site-specific DNA recombinase
VRAGRADVIVAWHPDRLHRSPVELEEFITLIDGHGVAVQTVQAGSWDLSTPSGRLIARQLGGVARYESEHKSERVRRALEQNASSGRSHGRRAYGWSVSTTPTLAAAPTSSIRPKPLSFAASPNASSPVTQSGRSWPT